MRLLCCAACKTAEVVDDYTGSLEVDPLVERLIMKHTERDPMAHGGVELQRSPFRLVKDIPENRWAIPEERDKIIALLNSDNKRVGLDLWVSEAMDTYREDAGRCYNDHNRPKQGCIDWRDDSKRIGRPTDVGRQVVKDNYKLGSQDPFLCDWCPVRSWVDTEVRFKAGLYKER